MRGRRLASFTSRALPIGILLVLSSFTAQSATSAELTEYRMPHIKKVVNACKTANLLKHYDVALLIDTSKSMEYDSRVNHPKLLAEEYEDEKSTTSTTATTTPTTTTSSSSSSSSKLSRWDWCKRHSAELIDHARLLSAQAPRVVLFGEKTINCGLADTAWKLDNLCEKIKPSGGTNAAPALQQEISRHLQRRANGSSVKPLVIAVLTDGSIGDKRSTRGAIVRTTRQMTHGDEVVIVVLKIGDDPKSTKYIADLDSNLMASRRAKFDIVDVKPVDLQDDTSIGGVLDDTLREREIASRPVDGTVQQ